MEQDIKVIQYRQEPSKKPQNRRRKKSRTSVEQAGWAIGMVLSAVTIVLLVSMFLLPDRERTQVYITDETGSLYPAEDETPLIEGEHTLVAIDAEHSRLLYLQEGGLYLREGTETVLLSQSEQDIITEPVCYDSSLTVVCWREYDRRHMTYRLCLWQQGEEVVPLEEGKPFLSYLRMSGDGVWLAYSQQEDGGDNVVILRNLAQNTATEVVHSANYLACYAVTEQGNVLYYDYQEERLCLSGAQGSKGETVLAEQAAQIEVLPELYRAAVVTFDGELYLGDFREGELTGAAEAQDILLLTENGVYYRSEGSLYYATEKECILVAEDASAVCGLAADTILTRTGEGIFWTRRDGSRFTEAQKLCGAEAKVLIQETTGACAYVEDGWLCYAAAPSARVQRLAEAGTDGTLTFGTYHIWYQDTEGRLCRVRINGGGGKVETDRPHVSYFIVFS